MNKFFVALESKYFAEVQECLAVIELYANKTVGVGDHPDILSVLENAVSKLDAAQSKLTTLRNLFSQQQSEEGQQTEVPPPA